MPPSPEPTSTPTPQDSSELVFELERAADNAALLCSNLCQRHLGDRPNVELLIAAFIANGHVLIEGAPGLGKTRLVRSLAGLLELDFGRVQCTPDLMPTDITGGEVLEQDGSFRFSRGPIFKQVLLADEINRATPRTQSALLEAMEERQVTSGDTSHPLPSPFFMAATQNPIELEGTYPLPEAQLDRFMFKVELPRPDANTLVEIFQMAVNDSTADNPSTGGFAQTLGGADTLARMHTAAAVLPLGANMMETIASIITASHPDDSNAVPMVRDNLRWGASPRAGISAIAGARALALVRGRAHVAPTDLRDALIASLRHRLVLRYEAAAAGVHPDQVVTAILKAIPVE